jgi:hypothetical protein
MDLRGVEDGGKIFSELGNWNEDEKYFRLWDNEW